MFLSILPKGQGKLDPLPTKAAVYQSSQAGFESMGRALENICSFAKIWLLFLSKEPWEKHNYSPCLWNTHLLKYFTTVSKFSCDFCMTRPDNWVTNPSEARNGSMGILTYLQLSWGQKGLSVFYKNITEMVLFGYKSYSSRAGSSDQEGSILL